MFKSTNNTTLGQYISRFVYLLIWHIQGPKNANLKTHVTSAMETCFSKQTKSVAERHKPRPKHKHKDIDFQTQNEVLVHFASGHLPSRYLPKITGNPHLAKCVTFPF